MNTALTDAQKNSIWYPKFLVFSKDFAAKLPNSLLVVTLVSNFGTFLLYMLTCVIAIVAFREHHMFNGFKHLVVPVFGLLANLACMLFYLIGPLTVAGMSVMEPYVALGIAGVWGLYGAFYFSLRQQDEGSKRPGDGQTGRGDRCRRNVMTPAWRSIRNGSMIVKFRTERRVHQGGVPDRLGREQGFRHRYGILRRRAKHSTIVRVSQRHAAIWDLENDGKLLP